MADGCEHLAYRDAADGVEFDHERPFCEVLREFVQPMRADICARRHNLDPSTDCEYYREEHDLGSVTGFDAESVVADDAGTDP